MAVKTERVDTKDMLDQLDAVRLSSDWSYRQLSSDMARVGVTASAQTLHQVLTNRESEPYDRTLHKIGLYLDALKAEQRLRPRRKAKGRAA